MPADVLVPTDVLVPRGEFLRADNTLVVSYLTMPQLQCALIFFVALALLALLGLDGQRRHSRAIRPDGESFTDVRPGG